MRTENYGLDADGNTILLSVEDDGLPPENNWGYADLSLGRVTVTTPYAGQSVVLTRNQENVTAIGNLYVYAPNTIEGVSFEIRSTNANDNGTVYWQIVE
jgi:hypothetical protein